MSQIQPLDCLAITPKQVRLSMDAYAQYWLSVHSTVTTLKTFKTEKLQAVRRRVHDVSSTVSEALRQRLCLFLEA